MDGGPGAPPATGPPRAPRRAPEIAPESLRPTLTGERWMVAAGHPLAAWAAGRVFDRGGNAVDAGVAGGLVTAVVQVDQCNLGGVAPILVRPAGGATVFAVAGLGWWGSAATVAAFRERFGDAMPPGAPVAVVPAAVSAWIRALQRFGTWSFADCARDAIELARGGFALDARLAASLAAMGASLSRWPSSAAVFRPAGRALRPGERLVQDALGRLLERLAGAERGETRAAALDAVHDAFYAGEPARLVARHAAAHGGWLTEEDVAAFDAEIEPAVHRRAGAWDVWTPPAWCQGPALLQALAILDGMDVGALAHGGADHVHLVAEATKLAFADRERFYGDPRFVDVPLGRLLSGERAAQLRAMIDPRRALPSLGGGLAPPAPAPAARRDTTHLCTLDADGTAFSATPSDTLDGGPLVPELGIIVSPRGVQSRLDAAHPAALGPRRRPRLTPAPAIAIGGVAGEGGADAEPRVLAFGCPGGDVILQGMLQAFLNLTAFGMTPQQAVEAPRFAAWAWPNSFHPHEEVPARVTLEARIGDEVAAELARRGHDVRRWPPLAFDAGSVSMVLDAVPPREGRRVLAAASDPRRIAYALGR